MGGSTMNYHAHKWNWMFWRQHGEHEILIYSPGSHMSGVQEYFVVVLFKTEKRDWWVCQFKDVPNTDENTSDVAYLRITNYGSQLRDAMTTCYALNKLIGAV